MVGRFLGSFLMKVVKAEKLLVVLGIFGVVLLLVAMFTDGQVAVWSLVLCGLANSVMYPTIFALGIAELGPMTSEGSGVITIGNVGGAVIPFAVWLRWPMKLGGVSVRVCLPIDWLSVSWLTTDCRATSPPAPRKA